MKKILLIAQREFAATAGTRAFIITMLVTPAMLALVIYLMPRLINKAAPNVEGEVAIIDSTGQIADGLRAYLQPDRIAARRQEDFRRTQESLPVALGGGGGATPSREAMDQAFKSALGNVPHLAVVPLNPGADLEAAKNPLKAPATKGAGSRDRLALIVVHPNAVVRAPGTETFGSYDLFVRGKLDARIVSEINAGMRDSIVDVRVRRSSFDRQLVDALTHVDPVQSRTVTAKGENATNEMLNMFMPMAFMILLLMSVLLSGQYLLTTTVEEKSNRVVEVLLSAVSPMELMTGKILGQMCVGLLVLALYLGLGIMALVSFASLGLLDPTLIVYLLVFYLLSYLTMGAFMAAIGSAVNEMRDAQGLMTPVMIVVMIPYFLWLPISRDPNSMLAIVLSFVPPFGNFVMMLRLASSTPPPIWQALLAIVVGAAGAYVAMWFAAKVFRIGLLMYGKPPSFGTLVKWARQG
jgi:ABC-2 type transport system permease protein